MTSASAYSEKRPSRDATTPPPETQALPIQQPPRSDQCWLHREQPPPGQPYIIITQGAIQQIQAHAESNLRSELGGALLGHAYRHEDKLFVEVQAVLPAVSVDHGPVHFTFNADSWAQLHRDREATYPKLDMVGWFHTHPALGVFYSSDDVVVHSAAFTLPWHVGLVVDPVRKELGAFGWVTGQLAPFSGCYELLDQQAQSVLPWRMVRTAVWYDHAPEETIQPGSQVYLPPNKGLVWGISSRTSLLVGVFGLLVSLILFVAWILPLTGQVRQLQSVALTLADQALLTTNAAVCPDDRLRILTPLTGSLVSRGTAVSLIGTADHPTAARYRLEIRPNGAETWQLLTQRRWDISLGQIARWQTSDYVPGVYELRLTAVDRNNVRLADTESCLISLEIRD